MLEELLKNSGVKIIKFSLDVPIEGSFNPLKSDKENN